MKKRSIKLLIKHPVVTKSLDRFDKIVQSAERPLLAVIIIFCLGMMIYGNILHAPFHFDDHEMLLKNTRFQHIPTLLKNWNVEARKFLTFFTFAVNYQIGGGDSFGYHLVNVLFHITTAILLYCVTLTLFLTPVLSRSKLAGQKKLIALFASLIFLAHPLQTQAVTYIWQRAEVLSGLLYLASYLLYLLGRLKKQKNFFYWTGFVFCLGLMAKGTIVTLPLMILLTEFMFFESFKKNTKLIEASLAVSAVFLLGIIFFKQLRHVLGLFRVGTLLHPSSQLSITYLYTQFRVVLKYIQLSFLPINQNIDYVFPYSKSFFEWNTFLSFLVLAAIVAIAVKLFQKHRLMSFGIFWFFIYLIPTSTIVALGPIWEHRVYLSLAGFSMFVVAWLFSRMDNKKLRNRICVGVVCLLSILTVSRNTLWLDPILLFEDTVKKSPRHPRPYLNLGAAYVERGEVEKAIEAFKKAVEIAPTYPEPHYNLGLLYMKNKQHAEAEEEFRETIRLNKMMVDPYLSLARLAMIHNNYEQAEHFLNRSLIIQPTESAFLGLGVLSLERRKYRKAEEYFQQAFTINKNSAKAYYYLGDLYFQRRDNEKALEMFKRSIKADSSYVEPYIKTGLIYYDGGDYSQAKKYLEAALQLNNNRADIYKYLSNVYYARQEYKKAEEYYQKSEELFSQRLRYTK